ncbi:hypothetical protein GE061_013462 [Apolygus lucorum]|uniref:Ig-like domain-containing protein n=1 Tax=Apolygus lucorum TaxID=248454 RepID=A0A8S9XQ38_APOLU|nr:hypothetical protein GE061_013462 [Apolygus lucorum]
MSFEGVLLEDVMMGLLVIILSVYLHAFSAKELAHDVKEVLLQSHNQDPNVDELLNLLYMDTTTQKYYGYPDRTTVSPPYFVKSEHSPNSTVQLGAEVTLHCKVNDLAEHTTVSWMKRHGDKLKLVSVGLEAYSSDPRYSVAFRSPNDWQLKLEGAQHSDEGHYECQVSSHPPIVQPYYLTVVGK